VSDQFGLEHTDKSFMDIYGHLVHDNDKTMFESVWDITEKNYRKTVRNQLYGNGNTSSLRPALMTVNNASKWLVTP